MRNTIRRIVAWLRRQRLYRAYPELREIDARIGAAKRRHMSSRALHTERQRLMNRVLEDETTRR